MGVTNHFTFYEITWKGPKPQSPAYPELLRYDLEICDRDRTCSSRSVLDINYPARLNFSHRYEVTVDAIYEFVPGQEIHRAATTIVVAAGLVLEHF